MRAMGRTAIDRLGALDAFMLRVSRIWPQDIGALAILDGGPLRDEAGCFRIDDVREAIRRRLHLVPRFRQVIHVPRRGLGRPLWVDAPTFDLAHHVRELPVDPPAGEAEIIDAVEELLRRRLDPACPLWEMWFLTGLPGGRVGLFVKIHHTIADGMAAMTTVATFLDQAPGASDVPPGRPWEPSPWPSAWELLRDNVQRHLRALGRSAAALVHPRATVRQLRIAWPAVRELLAEEPASATSLERTVGPGRRLALIRTNLEAVRAIGRGHGATVNDVLLAASAGSLRALLSSRHEPVDGTTVRTYVPVSLRRRLRGVQQGNVIAQMAVPLHLGETDPGRRLEQIAAETTERKARARVSLGAVMIGGGIGRRLMLAAVMRQRVNVTTASIPGPKVPLYLAGARLLEVFPVLPLVANEPLGIGALSYAGALTIGIAADRDAFPDLELLTVAMRDELHALGLPTLPAFDEADAALAPSSRRSRPGRSGRNRPEEPLTPSRARPEPETGRASRSRTRCTTL
jgi:diacylglycerol O-acyltransferase